MKKIFLPLLLVFLFSALLLADDIYIPPEQLPKNALSFIQKYFPDVNILYAEMDKKDYEVRLSNGVEIEFLRNGELKEIEGNYVAIPFEILSEPIANTVRRTYPNTVITKIKVKWNLYEVKLNNMMKLYIDANGQLLGQKFDD